MRENESDPHFWENFYRDVYPEVLSLAMDMGVDTGNSEDVATEVCLRMFSDMKEGDYRFFSRPTSYVMDRIRSVVSERSGCDRRVDALPSAGTPREYRVKSPLI